MAVLFATALVTHRMIPCLSNGRCASEAAPPARILTPRLTIPTESSAPAIQAQQTHFNPILLPIHNMSYYSYALNIYLLTFRFDTHITSLLYRSSSSSSPAVPYYILVRDSVTGAPLHWKLCWACSGGSYMTTSSPAPRSTAAYHAPRADATPSYIWPELLYYNTRRTSSSLRKW